MRDDRAVSAVLGGILLAAILTSALVAVRVQYVPQWGKAAEGEWSSDAATSLARMSGGNAGTIVIPMRAPDHAGLGVSTATGELSFIPSSQWLQLNASGWTAAPAGGAGGAAGEPAWIAVNNSTQIVDVGTLDDLRMRLPSGISERNGGDSIVVSARDASNATVGTFTVTITRLPSGYVVQTTVTDGRGALVYAHSESHFQQAATTPLWLDLTRPDYQFAQTLVGASAPLTLTLNVSNTAISPQNQDLAPDYSLSYRTVTGTTASTVGATAPASDFGMSRAGGSLRLALRHEHLPAQQLAAEGGALTVSQQDGQARLVAPAVGVTRSGDVLTLHMAVQSLTGDPFASAGGDVRLATTPGERHAVAGAATSLSLHLRVAHAEAWSAALQDALDQANVPARAYNLTAQSDGLRLVLFGLSANALSQDVILQYEENQSHVAFLR